MFSTKIEPTTFECAYTNIKEMPQSRLGYHSNNKYDEFPPIMADGRTITASWQPDAVLNKYLLKDSGIKSNWQYRQYMIDNGKDIMKYNRMQSATDAGYIKRFDDLSKEQVHSTPYMFTSYLDTTKPAGYQTSDLKELYLTREQLESRMVAPEITQEELLKLKSS